MNMKAVCPIRTIDTQHKYKEEQSFKYAYGDVMQWLTLLLVSANEVVLRQAQLLLAWVTVCRQANHLGHLSQLSLPSIRIR